MRCVGSWNGGPAYRRAGWWGVVALVVVLLLIPVAVGILEARSDRPRSA